MEQDIVDLYFSEEEFSLEREREIAEEYQRYIERLEELAERLEYELMMEM